MAPKVRTLRLFSINPKHPVITREDGAKSQVEFLIDLGLKNDLLGSIVMSPEQAITFARDLMVAIQQAIDVNNREGGQ
jgi:hypothetical protein